MFKNSSPNKKRIRIKENKKEYEKKLKKNIKIILKKKGKKATIWPRALQKSLTSKYLLQKTDLNEKMQKVIS